MIAFFGGTFDPFHLGHLHLAKEILKAYPITKFYFVPASQNPLKQLGPIASNAQRLQMIKCALKELADDRVSVLESELERSGKSYTLLTVQELQKKHTEEIIMVLGDDAFQNIEQWFEPKKLLESVHCIIIERDPKLKVNVSEILRNLHISIHEKLTNKITHSDNFRWIENKNICALPFSATQIRKDIEECWKKKALAHPPPGLQHCVWQVVKDNHLYAR